ncbi:methylcobalamin:coenzyme M methyltransferase [Peptococcaceae bacterium CEB3]|nr:methylcobalamin:coenzyme M methyltransferase [Peptococcaceae bacterium CEB3]
MNSYERALLTLNGEIPDRVPTFELMIDPVVRRALLGDSEDYADFCEQVGLDLVLTDTPSKLYAEKVVDAASRTIVNEWGIVRRYNEQIVSVPLEGPIKEAADLKTYRAPDPYDERRYSQLKSLLKRFKGKKLVGMHLHDSFNYPAYLRGMEQLFMDLILDPDLVRGLVRISVEHNIAIAERAIELGADFIILGDDYGSSTSTLVSPQHFREFFIPGLQEVVSAVKAKGAFCLKHCCGNINGILDDMVATGLDGLHPLDPSAGMDMVAVKQRYPNLTVMGGINCAEPLTDYSAAELRAMARDVIERTAPGGHFILASSNSIHSQVKLENFLAMQETVREFGKYDNG